MDSHHHNRINQSLSFIDSRLQDNVLLNEAAANACYSPYHYSRIFKKITGENFKEYVLRRKIELTASWLIRKPGESIEQISLNAGFNSQAVYSRMFRKVYGLSPSEFRKQCPDRYSQIILQKRKNDQNIITFQPDLYIDADARNWFEANASIEVKRLSPMNVTNIEVIGVDALAGAYEKLIAENPDKASHNFVTVYHDSFKVTHHSKVRMSACIMDGDDAKTKNVIAGGKYISFRLQVQRHEIGKAWSNAFYWMNCHGYAKADHDCFEMYPDKPASRDSASLTVKLYIPVR